MRVPLLISACTVVAGAACGRHPGAGDAGYTFPYPIHRVLVVVKENHTLDNYFTGFPNADTVTTAPLASGTTIQRPFVPDGGSTGWSPCHSHACAVTAYADGGMNGFDLVPEPASDGMQFARYTQPQLSVYWSYAQSFVLADHYFTTIAGPSTPNHLATIAAQSPIYDNPICFENCSLGMGCAGFPGGTVVVGFDQDTCEDLGNLPPCFDIPSPIDSFGDALTWRGYGDVEGTGIDSAFFLIKSIGGNPGVVGSHIRQTSQLLADLTAGDMPNFVHVDSVAVPLQEGPPEDPCAGENYTVELVNAVMHGPYWNETAILITWDDWGGWYDHVAPAAERCANGAFFYPGFRVPLLIISPYAKAGYVLHTVTEHASIPRLVEELFGLPFMNARDPHARDAKVGSLMDAFDFTQPPRPPVIVPPQVCP